MKKFICFTNFDDHMAVIASSYRQAAGIAFNNYMKDMDSRSYALYLHINVSGPTLNKLYHCFVNVIECNELEFHIKEIVNEQG